MPKLPIAEGHSINDMIKQWSEIVEKYYDEHPEVRRYSYKPVYPDYEEYDYEVGSTINIKV